MIKLNSYLFFPGNCTEAMEFYKECIGGELMLQKVKDTGASKDMSAEVQDQIMHSVLTKDGNVILFGSDMMDGKAVDGNTVNLCLDLNSEEEIRTVFEKLSQGGKVGHKLEDTFWGAIFGDLTDKYGKRWMFNYTKPKA